MKYQNMRIFMHVAAVALLASMALPLCACSDTETSTDDDVIEFNNASYDPTRELYTAYDAMFEEYYYNKTGVKIECTTSHGGSGSQARSVIEGMDADVVTLALAHDITLIEQAELIESGWISEFDGNSSPYTSTICFLVRKGNRKDIQDWDDLTKPGVEVVTPDPKSSGGACWNFLAAWYYAEQTFGGDEAKMKEFVAEIYGNVIVMDSGARGATTTFVENGQGDVLIAWENEAMLSVKEYPDEFEIVVPSISIKAEPSVAIVDVNATENGTVEIAKEYLSYLYSDEAQRLEAEHFYRPSNQTILEEYADVFDLNVNLCSIDDFGGWDQAYETFFVDDAIFDEIYNMELE